MRSLIREGLLLLNLIHQAVEVLVKLVLMCNLVCPIADFEDLDIRVDTGAQPVHLSLVGILAPTDGLQLPIQELIGPHLHLPAVISLQLLLLSLSIILYLEWTIDTLEVLLPLLVPGNAHRGHFLPEKSSSAQTLVLEEFDASLVDICKLPCHFVLLQEDGDEHFIVMVQRRMLVLILLLFQLRALLYLSF